jgi:hypothetical protein
MRGPRVHRGYTLGVNLPSDRSGCIATALTVMDRDVTFSEHIKGMESPKSADDG